MSSKGSIWQLKVRKKPTRDGQSTAIRLGQISANAAATLSPHANYPIHLFFVPTSNPLPCFFFKSFSRMTGIFIFKLNKIVPERWLGSTKPQPGKAGLAVKPSLRRLFFCLCAHLFAPSKQCPRSQGVSPVPDVDVASLLQRQRVAGDGFPSPPQACGFLRAISSERCARVLPLLGIS